MTRCRNCDSHLTDQYARVFGDNQDRVYTCPNCPDELSQGDRMSGAAAGLDVESRAVNAGGIQQ